MLRWLLIVQIKSFLVFAMRRRRRSKGNNSAMFTEGPSAQGKWTKWSAKSGIAFVYALRKSRRVHRLAFFVRRNNIFHVARSMCRLESDARCFAALPHNWECLRCEHNARNIEFAFDNGTTAGDWKVKRTDNKKCFDFDCQISLFIYPFCLLAEINPIRCRISQSHFAEPIIMAIPERNRNNDIVNDRF